MSGGSTEPEVIALLHRACRGETSALEEFYRRYWDEVLLVAEARLGQELRARVGASDVGQDIFIKILKALDGLNFQSEPELLAYVSKVAENVIRDLSDHERAQKRDIRRELQLDAAPHGAKSYAGLLNQLRDSLTPSRIASGEEQRQRLLQALDQLSPKQREAILLVEIQGFSQADAARQLEITAEAIRVRLCDAKKNLSAILFDSE